MFSEQRRQLLEEMPIYPGFSHIKRYWLHKQQRFAVKIVAGDFYISNQDELISTVLGSCVSVCIRDPMINVGGINHFILPDSERDILSASNRYGVYAMERLINGIIKHGGQRENFEIKLGGGSAMVNGINDVGSRNIQFIRQFLITEGLTTVAEDLGGFNGRKIQYNVTTGKLMVKKLKNDHRSRIDAMDEEGEHKAQLASAHTGDVELFNQG